MRLAIKTSFWWYLASITILSLGVVVSALQFPGGFDWFYIVASALASRRDNPAGYIWYASAFGLSMALLLPYTTALVKNFGNTNSAASRFAIVALRTGLVCGILLGIEGLIVPDLSRWIPKGHEILGISSFLGLYMGILVLLFPAIRHRKVYALPAVLVAISVLAIGVTQLVLYLEQRGTGWINTEWREMGIPFWLSYAFWQWMAIGSLIAGLGLLSLIHNEETDT